MKMNLKKVVKKVFLPLIAVFSLSMPAFAEGDKSVGDRVEAGYEKQRRRRRGLRRRKKRDKKPTAKPKTKHVNSEWQDGGAAKTGNKARNAGDEIKIKLTTLNATKKSR